MKKKRNKKKIFIILAVILVIFGTIAGLGIKYGLQAKEMYETAKVAKHNLEDILSLVKSEQYEAAEIKAKEVHQIIKDFRTQLSSSIWQYGYKLPKYGNDYVEGMKALEIADNALDVFLEPGFALLKENPLSTLKVEKSFNVRAVANYLAFAEEYIPKVEELLDEVSQINISLIPEGMIQGYVDKAKGYLDLYHSAEKYIPLVKVFIGDGNKDKLYLIAAQNSAEIRSSGGFPGSIGTFTIKDGFLTIGDFNSVYDVLSFYSPESANITYTEDLLFWYQMKYPRDACYNPNFERVGELMALGYQSKMGKKPDGIVSLSPIIIQDLLDILGEVTLSDGTVLNGENATAQLQHIIYKKYFSDASTMSYAEANNASDAVFGEAASSVMGLLFSNVNLDTIPKFLDIVEKRIDDRIIMIWMANKDDQSVVKSFDATGGFNTDPANPELGVYFSCYDPSKLGWFFGMDVQISTPKELSNGKNEYSVKVTLSNHITDREVLYDGWWIVGSSGGAISSMVYFVAPAGGDVYDFWTNSGVWVNKDYYKGNNIGWAREFEIWNYQDIVFTFKVSTAKDSAPLSFVTTPLLQEYRKATPNY